MIEKSTKQIEQEFQKKFLSIVSVEFLGTVLLGLGLYGKFAANGDAFHPLLNNSNVTTAMIAAGVLVYLWGAMEFVKAVHKKREEIERQRM